MPSSLNGAFSKFPHSDGECNFQASIPSPISYKEKLHFEVNVHGRLWLLTVNNGLSFLQPISMHLFFPSASFIGHIDISQMGTH